MTAPPLLLGWRVVVVPPPALASPWCGWGALGRAAAAPPRETANGDGLWGGGEAEEAAVLPLTAAAAPPRPPYPPLPPLCCCWCCCWCMCPMRLWRELLLLTFSERLCGVALVFVLLLLVAVLWASGIVR